MIISNWLRRPICFLNILWIVGLSLYSQNTLAYQEKTFIFSLPIQVNYFKDYDFRHAKTYQIMRYQCRRIDTVDPVEQATENEIRNQLNESGLKSSEHADLLIYYLITRNDSKNIEDCNKVIGYQGFHCTHCDLNRITGDYEGGTMVIQMIDASTNRTIWRGIGTANLRDINPEQELVLAKSYVQEMFSAPPWRALTLPFQYTLPIKSNYYRAFDFDKLRTYEIKSYESEDSVYPRKIIQTAKIELTNQLMEKGLIPAKNPDVSLHFVVTREDNLNTSKSNSALSYQGLHCAHCDLNKMPVGYRGGTLIVQLIDNKSRRLIWRAIGTANLDKLEEQAELTLLRQYITEMFNAPPWR